MAAGDDFLVGKTRSLERPPPRARMMTSTPTSSPSRLTWVIADGEFAARPVALARHGV